MQPASAVVEDDTGDTVMPVYQNVTFAKKKSFGSDWKSSDTLISHTAWMR